MIRVTVLGLAICVLGCRSGEEPKSSATPTPTAVSKSPSEPRDASKRDAAKLQIKALEQAVQQFALNNASVWPPTLEILTEPKADGGAPYLKREALTDPWSKPFQYDANGTHHKGKLPDIWTVTPGGETIGNWDEKK